MLERAFKWFRRDAAAPSRIESSGAWWVDEPSDQAEVFEALLDLLPAGSNLALEGPRLSSTVQSKLQDSIVEAPLSIRRGTLFPRSQFLHFRFDGTTSSTLMELAQTRDLVEVCDHIYAYKDDTVLVEWHDASSGNGLVVAASIAEPAVRAFANQLGVEVEATPS